MNMCAWIRWHYVELGAVLAAVLLAYVVSPWWTLLVALEVGGWAVHEYRLAVTRRDLTPPSGPVAVDAAEDESVSTSRWDSGA